MRVTLLKSFTALGATQDEKVKRAGALVELYAKAVSQQRDCFSVPSASWGWTQQTADSVGF